MAVFGDTLRQARAYKGVTLREAERATRINRYHLAALEEENFSALPPLIYQRGIVRNYATYLDLDANKLLSLFEDASGGKTDPEYGVVVKPLDMPSHWAPNFAIIAFMVVMSAIVFAWLYSAYFAPSEAQSTPTAIVATVTPVANERLLVPTSTPKPPTATPMPTETPVPPTPEATNTPKATEQVVEPADDHNVDNQTSDENDADSAEDEDTGEVDDPLNPPANMASIRMTAVDMDLYLTVVVDGETLWDGWIGAGGTTQWFTGSDFTVTTNNGLHTSFENDRGQVFLMSEEDYEATYYLCGKDDCG
jgi:cytoskeletal protein RodZ